MSPALRTMADCGFDIGKMTVCEHLVLADGCGAGVASAIQHPQAAGSAGPSLAGMDQRRPCDSPVRTGVCTRLSCAVCAEPAAEASGALAAPGGSNRMAARAGAWGEK